VEIDIDDPARLRPRNPDFPDHGVEHLGDRPVGGAQIELDMASSGAAEIGTGRRLSEVDHPVRQAVAIDIHAAEHLVRGGQHGRRRKLGIGDLFRRHALGDGGDDPGPDLFDHRRRGRRQ
jgi:hypothetical protein